MPKVDFRMEEGIILAWHKKEGEQVKEGGVLFEFETEKFTQEVCADESGVLLKTVAEVGDTVPVGATVAVIGAAGEEVPPDIEQELEKEKRTGRQQQEILEKAAEHKRDKKRPGLDGPGQDSPGQDSRGRDSPGQVRVSPLARKMAREHNIDLHKINQSFQGNVIKKEDVEAFIEQQKKRDEGSDESIPLKGTRKSMFERMSYAASTYASITTVQKADVTKLVEMKDELTRSWEQASRPRYIAFFVKAVSMALSEFPILNSTLDPEAEKIRLNKAVNIGIAVNSGRGLLVPVLHGVSDLTLKNISKRVNHLAAKAVDKKLSYQEFQDGTFTITNTGPLGAYLNTPIINPPQSAILGTCSINAEPAVIDGKIVVRKLMFLTLTYDHRIIEGAEAVGFLKKVKHLLEDPQLLK